jgi:hypothetical protein
MALVERVKVVSPALQALDSPRASPLEKANAD